MMLAWMIFGALVSLVIVCAAETAASAARVVAKPTRWIWGVSLAAVFVVVIAAPYREQSAAVSLAGFSARPKVATGANAVQHAPDVTTRIAASAAASLRVVLQTAARLVPASMNGYVVFAWAIASSLLLLLLIAVYARMRIARRRWPAVELHGVGVRLSDSAGPAVVGLMRPEIVVPRWLLTRDANEQRMTLAHEREHVRQRDHLLLAGGCLAVVLMPWNPAVWWMFSRLRLAIELDCDARVLSQGAEPHSYGSLLIDLAEQSFGLRMGAPALVDGSSHLQTRVMAMKKETHKFARVRGSIVGLAALSLLVVACEAKLPTSAEIDNMDVASAEKATTMAMASAGNVRYQIDGANATAEQAHALRPEQIVAIDVSQGATGDAAKVIYIRTVNGPGRVALRSDSSAAVTERSKVTAYAMTALDTNGESTGTRRKVRRADMPEFTGLFVVDGTIVDPATFKKLAPKDIFSIEVLKGSAAMAAYSDPRAANGVIDVKTKKAAP